jgi:hypothetical protein
MFIDQRLHVTTAVDHAVSDPLMKADPLIHSFLVFTSVKLCGDNNWTNLTCTLVG